MCRVAWGLQADPCLNKGFYEMSKVPRTPTTRSLNHLLYSLHLEFQHAPCMDVAEADAVRVASASDPDGQSKQCCWRMCTDGWGGVTRT